ncbi:putative lipoprotein YajG [Luteibacter sp. 621]|jgi:uncharacterized lipoprotein YajG|uniref:hypothetical protein n=1 Tax=Luteibacter sp. 621 TaxID=3373916 RepID=UPI003D227119
MADNLHHVLNQEDPAMRVSISLIICGCILLAGCATAPSNQAQTGPSCSSGQNGQTVACAATIAVSAVIKAVQKD